MENLKEKALKEINEGMTFLKDWDGDCLPTYYNITGQIDLLCNIGLINKVERNALLHEVNSILIKIGGDK